MKQARHSLGAPNANLRYMCIMEVHMSHLLVARLTPCNIKSVELDHRHFLDDCIQNVGRVKYQLFGYTGT